MSTFTESLRVLLAAYPRWDPSREDCEIWAMSLSDVPAEALRVAALQLVRESKYPPTIAEWRERARALELGGAAPELSIADAWDELLRNRKLAQSQRYESRPEKLKPYSWSSDLVRRAAEFVHWKGEWTNEPVSTTRAQFERTLRDLRQTADVADKARSALEFAQGVEGLPDRVSGSRGRPSASLGDGRILTSGEDWSKVCGADANARPTARGEQVQDERTR